MHRNENFRKIARIFILAFLCSEMNSFFNQPITHEDYRTPINLNSSDAATLENSKYQVSIRLMMNDKNFGEGHICSGAIIAPAVVLTAARCIYNYQHKSQRHPSEFKVVLGTLDRYQRTEHTLIYGVTHTIYPHSFEPLTFRDDIALLLLDRDIPESHLAVQPIPLITHSTRAVLNNNGAGAANYVLTGWGKVKKDLTSNLLLTANVTKLPNESCTKSYGEHFTSGMFCAANIHQATMDICVHDDIGAPLIYENQLIGIKTGAKGCTDNNSHPVVYTDIAHYTKWINVNIGDGTNQNSSIWGTLGFLIFTVFTLKAAKISKW